MTAGGPPGGDARRMARFVANGVFATGVHYGLLALMLETGLVRLAGVANGLAALVGISVSYAGNKYFVFRSGVSHARAMPRFLLLYGFVALLHALFLFVWTDVWGRAYTAGFVGATALSLIATYLGNRLLVFPAKA